MAEKKLTDGSLALEQKKRRVITIEATEKSQEIKLRVAAYARVSSASDDQLNSFAAQNKYYTSLISAKDNWSMVDIYADEGITGTSVEKREDFKRLLADCRRGKIDRILVKSISRFARNTKECLESIRELKSLGVSIYFEKENIDTATMSGEMMTALFASFAQAESESISGNMRWSYQKRMQSGNFITCKAPFGFRLEDGILVIEENEAKIVRMMFDLYLDGQSLEAIGEKVTSLGVATRDGKTQWTHRTVGYILRNEKYVGDSLLQKKYTTDTLPYVKKRNAGERDQYYVAGSHQSIVDRPTYEAVNRLLTNRSNSYHHQSVGNKRLTGKIECGSCHTPFKEKLHHGVSYWTCRTHDRNRSACPVTQIPEERITDAFNRMYFKLKSNGLPMLTNMLSNLQTIRNRRMLWSVDIIELNKKISELTSQNQLLTALKQQGLVDSDIFIAQSNSLAEQLREMKLKKERLLDSEHDEAIASTKRLIDAIEEGPASLVGFDEEMFDELIERIIVENNDRLRFRLKNGLELTEHIERTVR